MRVIFAAIVRKLIDDDWELVNSRIEQERAYLVRRPDLAPPLIAQKLLISGEDHRHVRHPGFDPVAICRAIWRRLSCRSREGASTIEQQLVRTITGRYERTLRRKFKEIFLAVLVCRAFEKKDLPAVYLSIAYYGWRMNGYRQACRRLHLHSGSLSLERAAGLIARLKYPEPKSAPSARAEQIDRRSKHLLTLYRRHTNDGTYAHLEPSIVLDRCLSADFAISVSEFR